MEYIIKSEYIASFKHIITQHIRKYKNINYFTKKIIKKIMTPYKITQNEFLIFGIKKTFKLIGTRPRFQGRKKEGVKIFTIIFLYFSKFKV